MIRGLLALAVGAAGALQADKALDRLRRRFRPSGVTGAVLNKVNERLERKNAQADHPATGAPR